MIVFHHRGAFWAGIVAVSLGVAGHLPMYLDSADMGYHMAGMPMDLAMRTGMVLILAGLALALFGLIPRRAGDGADQTRLARLRVRALDEAPLQRSHVALLCVMAAAVTIDVMKPTTLGFVMPGMVIEYDLQSPLNPGGGVPVALLPLFAFIGMASGAVLWGWLGDRIGRRASILIAGVMFIGTSICGAMPSFYGNLLMCFLMGMAVGGMLPIAFALLAETMPARHRGWLMVLIGGDVAGAYVITSFLASVLEPRYSWRILWLVGLPTGIAMILLNTWIPESPRFLVATGRRHEAEAVMRRFGARIIEDDDAAEETQAEAAVQGAFRQLARGPFLGLTVGVALFGVGWGLVNNGFLLWLPTNLRSLGYDAAGADRVLARAALIGFPVTFAVAWLYGFWSSKRTMVIVAVLTAAALGAFAVLGDDVGRYPVVLTGLIVILLIGTSSMLAVLTPYTSEVYPTRIRARGTGFAGMCTRAGGFLGVGVVLAGIAPPSLSGAALLGAVPVALAVLTITRFGVETRKRRLEEITASELRLATTTPAP